MAIKRAILAIEMGHDYLKTRETGGESVGF